MRMILVTCFDCLFRFEDYSSYDFGSNDNNDDDDDDDDDDKDDGDDDDDDN